MHNTKKLKYKIDVVIPFYNENSNLKIFIPLLIKTLNNVKTYKFRVIFIDDGSIDNGKSIVNYFKKRKFNKLKFYLLSNKKNEGQTNSYKKYLKRFKSDFFLRIDSDNQDNPKDILKILKAFNNDQDMIITYRIKRKHDNLLIVQGKLYSYICNLITGVKIKTFTSSLVLYRSKFLELRNLKNLRYNDHRYLPLLATLNGAKKIKVLSVKHNPRTFGYSKYSVSRKIILGPFEFMFFLIRYYLGNFRKK